MSEHTVRSVGGLVRKVPGYVRKQLRRAVVRRRLARYFERNPDHPALDREAALDAVRDADSVLFLCWGNICRSPLAERYLRDRLDERGIDGVTVRSAGLGKYEGKASPRDATAAAARYEVDLADHRSQRTSSALVESSDVIFVMDYNNYHDLTDAFPGVEGRTFFLGALLDDADATISDPHGKGERTFERVYWEVTDAVETLVDAFDERRR